MMSIPIAWLTLHTPAETIYNNKLSSHEKYIISVYKLIKVGADVALIKEQLMPRHLIISE